MNLKEFFKNMGCGAVIGVAVIIPGVSGGTLAVLLNIYDKLINAVSDLRKDFKNSFAFLLPVALGMALAFAAMYYPLKFALQYAPLLTVLLFTGLMLGSFPKVLKESIAYGFKKTDIISLLIPLAVVIGMCFIPGMGNVNLGLDMPVYGYFLLILMGALASCALVVPGVSGSLVLMIFGYYTELLGAISLLKVNFGHYLSVLALFAAGIVIGFFSIAKLMKFFLEKFPRGTRWAIIGFVVGSIPALLISFDYSTAPLNAVQISIGVLLCAAGIIGAYALTSVLQAKAEKKREAVTKENENGEL